MFPDRDESDRGLESSCSSSPHCQSISTRDSPLRVPLPGWLAIPEGFVHDEKIFRLENDVQIFLTKFRSENSEPCPTWLHGAAALPFCAESSGTLLKFS